MSKTILVPPDGGYGWIIVFASALNNFISYPLVQSFGLIFKDTFNELGLSAAEGSLIINFNSAFQMLVGIINGPLLNTYGYRKISVFGAILVVIGITLTAFANSFTHFIIAYGLITAFGMGLTFSSFSLAVNTYFNKKRNRAISLCMTLTGLGPIVIPQFITLLLQYYTVQGVTLILGAICAHSLLAAILLRPVKWYMVKQLAEDEVDLLSEQKIDVPDKIDEESEVVNAPIKVVRQRSNSQVEPRMNKRKDSLRGSQLTVDHDVDSAFIYGIDSNLGGSTLSLESYQNTRKSNQSITSNTLKVPTKLVWWKSASTVNLESSVNIFDDVKESKVYNTDLSVPNEKKPLWKRFFLRLAVIFDLNLLKDPIYVNIMIGMSLAIFAEFNFSVLTAFILADMNLQTSQIATFMSTVAVADIIFRFLAPYIGELCGQSARVMYSFTLLGLISTRYCLLLTTEFKFLMVIALLLGVAKGIRTVYMSLVIPTYVPIERLAAASGIQMMVNGLFILIGGPVIGLVRDVTGSYNIGIVIMNCVTLTTVLMWTCEYFIVKYKTAKKDLEAPINN